MEPRSTNPAIVPTGAVLRLPRWALVLFVLAYVLPGFVGRNPWKTIDIGSLGVMLELAHGGSNWWSPGFLGLAPEVPALLPYWLGAWALAIAPLGADPVLVSRIPYVLMLILTLACTWKAIELLARSPKAQPVSFAFGGQANPRDYSRAMADAGLLALIACLGLAHASHEVTPMAVQLCMSSLVFCGMAGLYTRYRSMYFGLSLIGLLGLCLSGAAGLALITTACALLWVRLDDMLVPKKFLWLAYALALMTFLALILGLALWQPTWRGLPDNRHEWLSLLRLWVWFTWPAWPLALWSLWVWQRYWFNARPCLHIGLPLLLMLPAAGATLFSAEGDRSLLLALPHLAALAAFALPTLKRGVSALIDWFTLLFFSSSALILWIVWLAGVTGWPHKPAANITRVLPGLDLQFSPAIFAMALTASLAWLGLVAWRSGHHRPAIWKSLLLPAGGASFCWFLLMSLWLPMIDFARSYAAVTRNAAALMSHPTCVQVYGLSLAQMVALQHHGQLRVDRHGQQGCEWLVLALPAKDIFEASPDANSWRWVQSLRRPTSEHENIAIYQRRNE